MSERKVKVCISTFVGYVTVGDLVAAAKMSSGITEGYVVGRMSDRVAATRDNLDGVEIDCNIGGYQAIMNFVSSMAPPRTPLTFSGLVSWARNRVIDYPTRPTDWSTKNTVKDIMTDVLLSNDKLNLERDMGNYDDSEVRYRNHILAIYKIGHIGYASQTDEQLTNLVYERIIKNVKPGWVPDMESLMAIYGMPTVTLT